MSTSWTNSVGSQVGWLSAGVSGGDPVVKLEAVASRVGIGTTLPSEKLTVAGNISARDGLSATGTNNYFSGNVGIGTIAPAYTLDVAGTLGVANYIYHNGDANTYIRYQTDQIDIVAGGQKMIFMVEGGGGDQADKVTINDDLADVDFQVKGDSEANLIRTDAANDRVGIGTSAPNETLTVVGNISASGGLSGRNLTVYGDISAQGDIFVNNNSLIFADGSGATTNFSLTSYQQIKAATTSTSTNSASWDDNVTTTKTYSGDWTWVANNSGSAYTAGSGIDVWGTVITHENTSSQASVDNSGQNFIQDITLDTYGHITAITSAEASGGSSDTNTKTTVNTYSGDWTWVANNSGSNYGGFNQYGHTNTLSAMGPAVFSDTVVLSGAVRTADDITATGTVQAEHLYSTDDAVIDDDLTVGGKLTVTGTSSFSGVAAHHAHDIFNKGISIKNADASGGYINFYEQSSNGTNTCTFRGKSSMGNCTITLPGQTGTVVLEDNTVTLSNKTFTDPVINVAGTDATGDVYYRNGSGVFTRLAIGSDDDVLTLASGIPSWAAQSGGGDITAVVAGNGLTGGATSGSATLTISAGALVDVTANQVDVDLTEASEAAIANGDYILFLDGGATGSHAKENIADVATLFAGTGLSATSSVININAAQTGITSLLATDIKIGEDDQTKIDFETANEIHFYTNNSNNVTVKSDGKVGIGTDSPDTTLHIVTANTLGSTFTGTTDGEGLRVDQSNYSAGNYVGLLESSYDDGQTAPNVRVGALFNASGAYLAFGTSNDYAAGITNTAMIIDPTGKVGIGTITPNEALTVVGDISANGDVHVGNDLVVKGNNLTINGVAYTFPSDNGDAGEQLQTDGSGTLTWEAAGSGSGMTSFQLEDDDGTEVSVSNAEEIKFIGDGIVTNWTDVSNGSDGDPFDMTFSVHQVQSNIKTLTATDIKIGEDDQTKIDFETADEIHFYAANVEQVYLGDNIFGPQSDSDVDLGSTGVRWKDAYVDSITVTGEVDGASLDISGNADIDGTLEADVITVSGTALSEYIADTAGAMFSGNTETGIAATYQDGDNTIDLALAAAQTTITSIYATDLILGEDSETAIDFGTVNEIRFNASNQVQFKLADGVITPLSDSDVDLGTSGIYFKNAYIDAITTTGNVTVGGNLSAQDTLYGTVPCELGFAVSDESTDLTTGTAKLTFRMPHAMTLTSVRANVNTVAAGSTIIVDINEGGSTILTTKLSIDAGEKTSTTAAAAAVIGGAGPALADDAEMKVDIDQIGSSTAGKGLKIWLIGTRRF